MLEHGVNPNFYPQITIPSTITMAGSMGFISAGYTSTPDNKMMQIYRTFTYLQIDKTTFSKYLNEICICIFAGIDSVDLIRELYSLITNNLKY